MYGCVRAPTLTRDKNALGYSSGNALEIHIDSTIPQQNQETTLLHEILEQINYRYELGLEHQQITILESALYQVIQDNPAIFRPGAAESEI